MGWIFRGAYILIIFVSMSCATTAAIKSPLPEMSTLESAIQKIKQNSPEIEKYYLLDETGSLVVRGKTESFEALYDLKNAQVSAGNYLVPFTVRSLKTGAVQEDILLWKPQKDGTGILLSLDDHFFEVWERYFDLFDRYNARITFFVLGTNSSFSAKAMKRGHDVGYHSLQHLELTRISRQSFYTETISQVENFRNAGVPLVSFAYPFGFYESWMNKELLKTYRILRGFNTSFQAYSKTDIMQNGFVFSRSVDNTLFKRDDDFMTTIDVMLRTIKFTGRDLILPLTSHNISDTDDWGIKPRRLEYILQTASDLQLQFYRYRDIISSKDD